MKCFNCGFELTDGSVYCANCGVHQPNAVAASPSDAQEQTLELPSGAWQQQLQENMRRQPREQTLEIPSEAWQQLQNPAWQQSPQAELNATWQQTGASPVAPGGMGWQSEPPVTPGGTGQPATPQPPVKKKTGNKALVGICVGAAAICAICAGVVIFGGQTSITGSSAASETATQAVTTVTREDPPNSDQPSGGTTEVGGQTATGDIDTQNDQNPPTNTDNPFYHSGETDEQESTPPTDKPTSSGLTASFIDLTNPSDYYDINIFLSNFAEWPSFYSGHRFDSFDRNHPNTWQLVNWSMWHNALNNGGTLENGSYELSGAPASSWSKEISGGDPRIWLRRMETERVEGSIQRYIGISVDLTGYDSGDGAYFEQDGYLYEGLYRGSSDDTCRVLLANSVEDAGGGLVRVEFTIYSAGGNSLPDKSWYGMGDSELRSAMSSVGSGQVNTYYGEALVESAGEGAQTPFTLASFKVY